MRKLLYVLTLCVAFGTYSFAGFYDENPEFNHNRRWNISVGGTSAPDVKYTTPLPAGLETSPSMAGAIELDFQLFFNKNFGLGISAASSTFEETLSVGSTYEELITTASFTSFMFLCRYPLGSHLDVYGSVGLTLAEVTAEYELTTFTPSPNTLVDSSNSGSKVAPTLGGGVNLYAWHFVFGAFVQYIPKVKITVADDAKVEARGTLAGGRIGLAF
ncbi:hypothetical protein RsTz2092_12400 [Deferribacterales bacterium RsTz2092]|nr:hypothetical protein AGMMS49941_07710 [Deferribacterales bacterium]